MSFSPTQPIGVLKMTMWVNQIKLRESYLKSVIIDPRIELGLGISKTLIVADKALVLMNVSDRLCVGLSW